MADRRPVDPIDLIRGVTTIASLPSNFLRLDEVVNSPRSSLTDIGAVISEDPGLSARLLRVVNSAFYGFPSRIDTISRAITVIGTQQLRDLALATSVINLFEKVPSDFVDMETFWRHSVGCGVAARVIATFRRESNSERYFVAGLLHDIGSLVLYTREVHLSLQALERAREEKTLLHPLERQIIGFDHAAVGLALLKSWNLPQSLQAAVAFHHDPIRASAYPVEAATVHVADIIANAMQLGSNGDIQVAPLDPQAWSVLKLSPSILGSVMEQVERQFEGAVKTVIAPTLERIKRLENSRKTK